MESFHNRNFMEVQSYSYDVVRKRLITGTFASSLLPADSLTVRFLPYATLLYWVLQTYCDEEGTAEVIHLQSNFDTSVVFPKDQMITKSIVLKWAQNVEMSWEQLNKALQQYKPEHITDLRIMVNMYQSGSDSWNAFVT